MTAFVTVRRIPPSVTALWVSAVIFATILVLPSGPGAAPASPTPEFGVAYDPSAANDPDRTYDYFPPKEPGGAVVIVIQSHRWSERIPNELLVSGLVKGVIRAGHAAFVLRHRAGARAVHPAPIEDVARGFAHALARAGEEGLDTKRVFVVGHTSGAQLALLLALDPRYLAALDLTPESIAGVVSLSGILDLGPHPDRLAQEEAAIAAAFPSLRERAESQPASWLDRARPPILLLTAGRDLPRRAEEAAAFVATARDVGSGPVQRFVVSTRDTATILDLVSRGGAEQLLEFLAHDPAKGALPERWQIVETWKSPPFTTEDFHTRFAALVDEYLADEKFTEVVNRPFPAPPGTPLRLRFARYRAIDLLDLLEAMGPADAGRGDFLVLTNARGEKAFFPMSRMRELRPRVVIGVDGERNLFRATDLYHTRRRYSWVDVHATRVDMARPLGAFLYFPDAEPKHSESLPLFGRYALTTDSFALVEEDPRAVLDDLPAAPRRTVVEDRQCISCHRLRDVGGRAFHIRARDAKAVGGHALPLERYPAVVWKRFVFEQEAVAAEVGANVVDFTPEEAQALYDMVVAERARRGVTPWHRPERDRDRP